MQEESTELLHKQRWVLKDFWTEATHLSYAMRPLYEMGQWTKKLFFKLELQIATTCYSLCLRCFSSIPLEEEGGKLQYLDQGVDEATTLLQVFLLV